jgi:hypothetical protein
MRLRGHYHHRVITSMTRLEIYLLLIKERGIIAGDNDVTTLKGFINPARTRACMIRRTREKGNDPI